ncbi:uncharacterized protein C8R40DRAFT_1164181 [Lentinula edodes]|uniref:uncharacterized protein n=1 Tax=Lentinula edodes TaxID=5353 RepID=UPI001E8EE2F1|nr:uncharacterized protein C8R40DRAFT_1164181 [Lentinula edodes]KAH7867857.1 hypothetical protein C8R40DRAFT_1164181 [Lentinula edodes]
MSLIFAAYEPYILLDMIMELFKIFSMRIFREFFCVFGWVQPLRPQKDITFLTLCDGTGYLQVVLSGRVVKSTVELVGMLQVVPEGETAPGGHEIIVNHWQLVGAAPLTKTNPSIQADLCHLVLHGEVASAVLQLRAALPAAFRQTFVKHSTIEVTPPCLVQAMVKGGATLFKLDYYGQLVFLTQSSQLYLETCLPVVGDVFCVQESFRAENNHTRRHLSEYTHLEAELGFINFDDLMIEAVICESVDILLANPSSAALIKQLKPKLQPPARPFLPLSYVDAIIWLNEHGIKCPEEDKDGNAIKDENGKDIMVEHTVGNDIAKAAEQMTDIIGKLVFLYRFPAELKAFYMKRMPQKEGSNVVFTASCDLLIPNVGEIVGGSMRISDYDELITTYKQGGMDPSIYYWYTDQRRYGTCEHGGYGLGVELGWQTATPLENAHFTQGQSNSEIDYMSTYHIVCRWPERATP